MQKSWRLIAFLGLGGAILLAYARVTRQTLYEPPSPEIEQLALVTTMTPEAQQLFYKQSPTIEPKEAFRQLCRKPGQSHAKTIILGCFTHDGYEGNIVIQSVTDPRLDGMMEVIAAHEMLHAVYQDLSRAERARLAPKLRQAAKRVKATHLLSVLEDYENGDPETYVVELHSYLGSELADLGDPDLEAHYRRYFQDRQQVIAFAQRSRSTLAKLEAQAEQLKPEIDTLEASIKAQKTLIQQADRLLDDRMLAIERMKVGLDGLKQQAEALLRQGDPRLVQQFEFKKSRFNTAVRQYNQQVKDLKQRVTQLNQQVETYKQKVDTYNELAKTNRSILDSLRVDRVDEPAPLPE